MSDGQSLLVNAYFEVNQALTADESDMAYSLCIDPKKGAVNVNNPATIGDGGEGNGNIIANGTPITFAKYDTFANMFNQYRVNSATIKLRTDAACGLENAVICSTDKGNHEPVGTMRQALTGAHKSYSLSDSRRELSYGCKNIGQDLDFRSTNDDTTLVDGAKKYIKIFQKLPKAEGGLVGHICRHQVQVTLSLTMKDTKTLN